MKRIIVVLCVAILILGLLSSCAPKPAGEEQGDPLKAPDLVPKDEREYMEYGEAVAEYKEKIGYETMVNSAAALEIILPAGFTEVINHVEIGSFLQARNELSKQNGFDFADFMGKRVVLYTCSSETDDDLVLLIYDQKIIGAWKDSTRGGRFFSFAQTPKHRESHNNRGAR